MLFGPSVELAEAMTVLTLIIGQSSRVNIHELMYGHVFKHQGRSQRGARGALAPPLRWLRSALSPSS